MNTLKRNNRGLYLCSRYVQEGVELFKEPVYYEINYNPTSSAEQLMAFGVNYSIYLIAKVLPEIGANFHAGDRCYIYAEPPETHDELCKEADYVVNGEPTSTLNVTEIKFKRLSENEQIFGTEII